MSVFTINGKAADTLADAFDLCREVWAEHKAPAVLEQRKEALSKPNEIDRQRAELGVLPKLSGDAA